MRIGDRLNHPWQYLRRDVPHHWYVDDRDPLMGFLNRDEATLLHNIALQFKGKAALEIGSWRGWSTCHLALAGVTVDVFDPAHGDPDFRAGVEDSLQRCGVRGRVNLTGDRSPQGIHALATKLARKWSLFFIDGDHEAPAPLLDTITCLAHAAGDCAFIFHDLASPNVAAGVTFLREKGFAVRIYQTAQIMGMAWRGDVMPVDHTPDPAVAWQIPPHLEGLSASAHSKPRKYKDLSEMTFSAGEPLAPSVCIVSNEIIGPFKNGGIGTSMTALAETLASAGLRVTVLYTGSVWTPDIALSHWQRHYAGKGIDLAALDIAQLRFLAGPLKDCGFGVAWLVYQFLSTRQFDVVHFNDCCGDGAIAIAAKEIGHAFPNTLLVVAMHSPSQWVLELNRTPAASVLFSAYNYAERLSIRHADVVWSPSKYMLNWASEHRFDLPEQTFIQQYAVPSPPKGTAVPVPGRAPKPKEIVFFGRLEERKGLRLFCNAIHSLRKELADRHITVTFLGKSAPFDGTSSVAYIERHAAEWPFDVKTLDDLGQPEALAYLSSGEKLAVMPSALDNSPCTIYEALELGIPFLASRAGGIPELIHDDDRDKVLFDCSTGKLRAALAGAIDLGGWVARPSLQQSAIVKRWTDAHEHWRTFLRTRDARLRYPKDVVAIVDHPADADLAATLRSLQTCAEIRRTIVLNRSGKPIQRDNVIDIDLRNQDADALESVLDTLGEEAILLVHSGVIVRAEPLTRMLCTLQRADGLIPAAQIVDQDIRKVMPPLGGSAAFSLFEGATFTGGMLVRAEVLLKAKFRRPLTADCAFMGLSDYCVTHGGEIMPYPEVCFGHPQDFSIKATPSVPSRVAAYEECDSGERYYMLATSYSASSDGQRLRGKRQVAMAFVDLGFARAVRLASWGLKHARGLRRTLRWKR